MARRDNDRVFIVCVNVLFLSNSQPIYDQIIVTE